MLVMCNAFVRPGFATAHASDVVLLWLYVSAAILIVGAELNAELEHQTAADTTTGPDEPIGPRDAVVADSVAG